MSPTCCFWRPAPATSRSQTPPSWRNCPQAKREETTYRLLRCILAGGIAVQIRTGQVHWQDCRGDIEAARQILDGYFPAASGGRDALAIQMTFLAHLGGQTQAWLTTPEVWPLIEVIAVVLQERRTIGTDTLQAIIADERRATARSRVEWNDEHSEHPCPPLEC